MGEQSLLGLSRPVSSSRGYERNNVSSTKAPPLNIVDVATTVPQDVAKGTCCDSIVPYDIK